MAFWKGVLEKPGKKDLYGKRADKAVLKFDTAQQVKQQFGWLPMSVFRPGKGNELRRFIDDGGEKRDDNKRVKLRTKSKYGFPRGVKISEFNPHLCSVIVKYWSVKGDHIVDPFSGRATRGLVSLALGRSYEGYDVAPTTFKNTSAKVCAEGGVMHYGDGCALKYTKANTADLVMTCPPYHDIEGYESAPGQLSDCNSYDEFLKNIGRCTRNIARVLKPGKFCCWVCGDWREKGVLHLFHEDSSRLFQEAGLVPWDIIIVENISPWVWVTTSRAAINRYTCKTHEYLQVFRKPE